jgi:hypothetical protein
MRVVPRKQTRGVSLNAPRSSPDPRLPAVFASPSLCETAWSAPRTLQGTPLARPRRARRSVHGDGAAGRV